MALNLCYNSCKCVEHEGTPKELISKQLGVEWNPGDDNMYTDIQVDILVKMKMLHLAMLHISMLR